MEMLVGIFGGMLVKLVSEKVVSHLMLILGRAWADHTTNKYDDQVLDVIAGGLGVDSAPLKAKL